MKFKISELFYSAQGEGRFVGVPSVFMRTFGCNFKCEGFGCKPGEVSTEREQVLELVRSNPDKFKKFEDLPLVKTGCDSYASWDPKFKEFSPNMEVGELVTGIKDLLPGGQFMQSNGNHAHLVITGGEPLLGWQKAYPELLNHPSMSDLADITFETNGTQELSEEFHDFIQEWTMDLNFMQDYMGKWREITFSVSPKLSVSGEKWEEAIRPEIIKRYQEVGITYLKFVVGSVEDFAEVDRAVAEYRAGGFLGSVYVMPVGGTAESYNENRVVIADEALKRGYWYSPRLHVDLWGNGWGK
jgi:organic radical activating enzyme